MTAAGATTVDAQAVLSALNDDGFSLNWTARAVSNRKTQALAIRGGQWQAGAFTIEGQTSNATATVSGIPFTPIGMSFMGVSLAENATNAATTENKMSVGTASGTASRRSQGTWNENNNATASEINTVLEYDSCLAFPSNAGALAESLDVSAMNYDGFTVIVDTNGGVTSEWVGYVAFGGESPVTLNNYLFGRSSGLSLTEKIR